MSTKVVHCKKEPYDVYIGRPSKWGNPFPIGPNNSRNEVIAKCDLWLDGLIEAPNGEIPPTEEEIEFLRGKRLGCYCKPKPCHGDLYVKRLEK